MIGCCARREGPTQKFLKLLFGEGIDFGSEDDKEIGARAAGREERCFRLPLPKIPLRGVLVHGGVCDDSNPNFLLYVRLCF